MTTIKIKIEKCEKINEGVLYIYYKMTNLETLETRRTPSSSYYGDEIINLSTLTEKQLNEIPVIHGKRYGDEIIISSEIREYSEENGEIELEKEGWDCDMHNAIEYVMF